jgi:hypothetical protein
MAKAHFHIRWLPRDYVDWEPFEKEAEAQAAAEKFQVEGETFRIEEFNDSNPCPRCPRPSVV